MAKKSVKFFVKSTVKILQYMRIKYWMIKSCRRCSTDGQMSGRNMSLVTM